MVPRREEKREEKTEGAGHRRRKAAMMPRQEEKREEKTEGAGHRRRKEVVVPRQEGKREEKPKEAGHRRRKAAVMPHQKKSEKLQTQQKTGCQMAPCSVFIHCTDTAYCTSEVVSAFCFLISSKPFNTAS